MSVIDEIIDIKYRDVDPEKIKYLSIENELVKMLDEVRNRYSDIDVTNFNSQFTEILQEIVVFRRRPYQGNLSEIQSSQLF